jgi:DNA-directed RNA polymerase specialized sigma24 family protein
MDPISFPEELLDRAKRGEAVAFQELYARARAFAYRIGVAHFELKHEDAEDVAQEVTWSFHRNLPLVERPDSWLFAAVRNQVHRLQKEPARTDLRAVEQASCPLAAPHTDLWDGLLRLSTLCRRLILHLFFWGYTEREIGRRQHLHHTTVGQRKRRCFGNLFQIMDGDANGQGMLSSRRDPASRGERTPPEPVPDLP